MSRRTRLILTSVAAFAVLLSLLITLNGVFQFSFFPTWDSVFTAFGLQSGKPAEGELRVTVLDVGNADCILLQSGNQSALIDAGENDDEERIISALKSARITHLDYVIATHPDADHIGGMDAVVRQFTIGTFIMSFMPDGYEPTTVTYERMLQAMVERNVTPTPAKYGDTYAFGDATITIVSGTQVYTETNDQSVVCHVSHGDMDFLFMGDAGKDVERDIQKAIPTLTAEVIKVGHHGSRSSSDGGFIRQLSPDLAVITCGVDNSYQHPHTETMDVLKRNDVMVYRSDVNGTIVLTSDGNTVSVKTEKERR